MSLSLTAETKDFIELEKYYSAMQERSLDLHPIERELGDIQREELKLRFLSSPGTEVGGVVHGEVYWNKLSDWYLSQNPRRRGKQIAIDTQRLKIDATTPGPGNSSRANKDSYTFEINTPYAAKQDEMRSLLFWSETLLDRTQEAILNYILTGEKENSV